jgi:uridine phosphorylase
VTTVVGAAGATTVAGVAGMASVGAAGVTTVAGVASVGAAGVTTMAGVAGMASVGAAGVTAANLAPTAQSRPAARPPLMARNDHESPSVFRPENMLREARRQKGLSLGFVAPLCVLDPDGDVVRHVRATRDAHLCRHWACYHTQMWEWAEDGHRFGIVGCAVGASFSVLVAEQLFVSGCELLISVASAGQIAALGPPPYHILIERALRDEGTSYHYLPPAEYVGADPALLGLVGEALQGSRHSVHRGATWTTDAPFRETAAAIALRRHQGVLAVEMEAAALYAFGQACGKPVLCFAHVTNQLGCVHGDFEKGAENGAHSSLSLVRSVALQWRRRHPARHNAASG